MKSKILCAAAVILSLQACNKPSSAVKAVVVDKNEVQLSQSEIAKILEALRSKSDRKDQLLDAEAALKSGKYVSYSMDHSKESELLSGNHNMSPGAMFINIHYAKGQHNEYGENISARIVCVYYVNEKGEYAIDRVFVEYIGKTYSA